MTLTDKAYLTIDDGESEAIFELFIDLEEQSDINKQFIMSDRGQYVQEAFEELPFVDSDIASSTRRRGYHIDGGAGSWEVTLSFSGGLEDEDIDWGDGSEDDTKDASGPGVHPVTRKQVLEEWIGRTRTDSFGQARLYWGEWTDGRFESESGAFERPMFVAIQEATLSSPDVNQDVNTFEGTLSMQRVALFPESVPTDLDGAIDLITESVGGIVDR